MRRSIRRERERERERETGEEKERGEWAGNKEELRK
jgi:hypothetical protein